MVDITTINVEVAYATPQEQVILELVVDNGSTVAQVLAKAKIEQRFSEIDLSQQKVGIFSKPCAINTVLRPGDRVEIYRPLQADPKAMRKKRAAEGKTMRKGV